MEVVCRGEHHGYRLVHGDTIIDWLTLADVERLLADAGVARHQLAEADAAA